MLLKLRLFRTQNPYIATGPHFPLIVPSANNRGNKISDRNAATCVLINRIAC